MPQTYTLPLNDPAADLQTVGGKGMSLAKLANAGLPVPDGFHITTAAYRQFVAANQLQAGIDAALDTVDPGKPATLEIASQAIGRLFAQASMPGELAEAIRQAYTALPGADPNVAVRSSATAEDLPEASFAGQQETYLNIRGADQVLEATQKCWASLWTGRAIGYRTQQGIPSEGVALAVVVQLLVEPEAAGILFTANPINGRRDEAVINAAWGLGEAVVGGAVTPDTLTLSKANHKVVHREIAEKLVMTVPTPTGTEERAVPEALQMAPVLNDKQAGELIHLGEQIEALYGSPMDIEWTLADGKFAIVQARPVTALPEAAIDWRPPTPNGTYMRASVADLMPEPLSPLYTSLAIPAQRAQMQPMAKRLTGSEPVLAEDYVTTINNYAYMNARIPAKGFWWVLTGLIPMYPKIFTILVPLWRDELHPDYQAAVAEKKGLAPAELPPRRLWAEAQELVDAAAYYICGLMFATMGASAGSEALLTQAYNRLAKQEGDPEAAALLMGWDNIPVRSEKSLYDIAKRVSENAELARYLRNTASEEIAKQLQAKRSAPAPHFAEFQKRFEAHMDAFGHVVFQLDFAEPLPRELPEMMLETSKMYLRGEGVDPHQRQKASEQLRIQTTETMLKRLKGLKRWAFVKALNWGQSLAEVREDALAEIGLAYPMIRALLHELGQRLVDAGAIQQAGDIYWLEKNEIAAKVEKLESNQVSEDLSERVKARKERNERLRETPEPPMIPMKTRVWGVKADLFIAQSEDTQTGNVLKGAATSSGKVTGPACVVHGAEDFEQMKQGDVLVASTTTPAWTPLFAMASAVVTDIGGPLSHGSIVAREYGIPAVMGTGVATARIADGQTVTVDGTAGTVTLE